MSKKFDRMIYYFGENGWFLKKNLKTKKQQKDSKKRIKKDKVVSDLTEGILLSSAVSIFPSNKQWKINNKNCLKKANIFKDKLFKNMNETNITNSIWISI